MNIGSREVFQKSKDNGYVTNGMIAWFDGIWNTGLDQHDSNATTWKDLANNGFDAKLRYATFNDNSLVISQMSSNNQWAAQANKPLPFNSNSNYFEIAFYTPSSLANNCWFLLTGGGTHSDGSSRYGTVLYAWNQYQRIGPCTGNPCTLYRIGTSYTFPAGNHRYAFDHDFQMKDLEVASVASFVDALLTSGCSYSTFTIVPTGLNGSTPFWPSGTKIYALRIYDHRLSEAERIVNYNLDVERFKL